MIYRALRNLALARGNSTYAIVKRGEPVDPAWVSDEGLARLLARRYVRAEAAMPDIPVTAIRGIGAERAKGLATIGIATVAGLLAASPQELEKRLSNLTMPQIADWQAQAAILLEKAAPETNEVSVIDFKKECKRCGKKTTGHRA